MKPHKRILLVIITVILVVAASLVIVLQSSKKVDDAQTYYVASNLAISHVTPVPSPQKYGSLNYNSIAFNESTGVIIHFLCPNCGYDWTAAFKPYTTLTQGYDFNHAVVFVCPSCNSSFSLFVALHNGLNGVQLCLQRTDAEGSNGIPVNWWQKNSQS